MYREIGTIFWYKINVTQNVMKPRYEPLEPSIPKSKKRADPGALKNALARADDMIHKMAKRTKLATTYMKMRHFV